MKTHHKISLGGISLFAVITLILGLRFGINNASTANSPLVAGSETSDDVSLDASSEEPTESPVVPEEEVLPPEEPEEETSPLDGGAPITIAPEEEPAPVSEPVAPPAEEPAPVPTPEPEMDLDPKIPAPFIDVRSALEPVSSSLDWLYTLRAHANYDEIGDTRTALKENLSELMDLLEQPSQISYVVDGLFCSAEGHISTLRTDLAPFADDKQEKVDGDNTEVLDNATAALNAIKQIWTSTEGRPVTCSS
jgi:hypothetical protein